MTKQTKLGRTLTLPGTSTNLLRMGYGAMQLAGPKFGDVSKTPEEAAPGGLPSRPGALFRRLRYRVSAHLAPLPVTRCRIDRTIKIYKTNC